MWLWLALLSAFLLGFYDICKKKALAKNGPIEVLFAATAISTLLLAPCLFVYGGPVGHHLMLAAKAVLVSASWISGMYALKLLPITTVSPLKATRPFFVVLLSLLIFGEKLNALQYAGVALALASIALMSFSGKRDSAENTACKEGSLSAYTDNHNILGSHVTPPLSRLRRICKAVRKGCSRYTSYR